MQPPVPSGEHRALIDKVEAFTGVALERRRADMRCGAGCSSCCEVSLSVTSVEAEEIRVALAALSPATRAEVALRGARAKAREAIDEAKRCVMLEADGRCAVYAHRPLVCRTQGHALRYPPGFIPEAAVRARSGTGDVTYCPLNFTQSPPNAEDVIDAERIDQILGIVAQRFALARGTEPQARITLTDLAAGS